VKEYLLLSSDILGFLFSTYVLQNIRFYPSVLNVIIFLSHTDTEKKIAWLIYAKVFWPKRTRNYKKKISKLRQS